MGKRPSLAVKTPAMKFFRVLSCFSLLKKSLLPSFTDALPFRPASAREYSLARLFARCIRAFPIRVKEKGDLFAELLIPGRHSQVVLPVIFWQGLHREIGVAEGSGKDGCREFFTLKKREDAFDDCSPALIAKWASLPFTFDYDIMTSMLKTAQAFADFILTAKSFVNVVPRQQASAIRHGKDSDMVMDGQISMETLLELLPQSRKGRKCIRNVNVAQIHQRIQPKKSEKLQRYY